MKSYANAVLVKYGKDRVKYLESVTISMSFYSDEHRIFKQAFSIRVSNHEAEKIIRKFVRHFKTKRAPSVRFYRQRKSIWRGETGRANGFHMHLNENPSVGLLIHEFAHVMQCQLHPLYKGDWQKEGRKNWHDIYFLNLMMKIDAFAKSKKYWVKNNA